MIYQVLARKWRPRNFATIVGQQHVTQALINGLREQRLHHAYLFTGTRGIGKTTLARIVAKCLNCEQGVSAEPCGKCSACQEIDQGRFIDLIEVDAASRTKVEDTRELLDNVQYAPTRGRYKVYLIDEVHMLSGHSFNALLKTLEEPPEHVKFLLATTDPQKLPITVLSRCLQFNLKKLPIDKISTHLEYILQQEKISYEAPALTKLAKAADGSIRDALSLLDQAIAYGNQKVNTDIVNSMLGTIPETHLYNLLHALATHDAKIIFDEINKLAELAADFSNILEELLELLHRLALTQFLPQEDLKELAELFSPQDIQLYYQIALIGRRDLPLAPSPKSGFEMIMLRMLAFQPQIKKKAKKLDWNSLLHELPLSPATKALAMHCTLHDLNEHQVTLLLHSKHAPLLNEQQRQRLHKAFNDYFKRQIELTINVVKDDMETPDVIATREQNNKQEQAENSFKNDSNVAEILKTFDATIIPDSIKPIDK